jgi:hypothetical protein
MIATHAVKTACPACRDATATVFHEQHDVPVSSNRPFYSREAARACRRGDVRLAFCHACGFISNVAYDPRLRDEEAETGHEASPRFREYTTSLARKWVRRHGLRSKTVLEIGAGRGEFLRALVQHGVGHAIGVDPILATAPSAPGSDRFTWIAEDYRGDHLSPDVAAIVCRHTLEHVPDTADFLATLRSSLGERDLVLLFEVPDVLPILHRGAFHDVYYEHCSYFTAGSVARAFAAAGFTVERVEHTYAGQYLVIEARPASGRARSPVPDDRRPREAPVVDPSRRARRLLGGGFQGHRLPGRARPGRSGLLCGGCGPAQAGHVHRRHRPSRRRARRPSGDRA